MPDLTDLLTKPVDQSFFINQLIGGDHGFPEKMLIYRRNFVRLADKALRDYGDARNAAIATVDKQNSHMLGIPDGRLLMRLTTNKLEDCIVTVRRLFNYFERIKSDTTSFPIERLFKKRIEALESSIREMRDLIVHMDEDICGASVAFGNSIGPVLNATGDTISVGKRTLSAEVLARAMRLFYDFALDFAECEFRPDGTYGPTPKSGPVKP